MVLNLQNYVMFPTLLTVFKLKIRFILLMGNKYRVYDGTNMYEVINPITEIGTLKAATVANVTLPDDFDAEDDAYNDYNLYFIWYRDLQTRTITDYEGSTKIATIDANWKTVPDNTSMFYMTNIPQGISTVDETENTICYAPLYYDFNNEFKGLNNIEMVTKCKRLELHKTRLWFSVSDEHPNMVISTDIDNMLYVPANIYVPPVTNDGDYINKIISFDDSLVIVKQKHIFALYGYDENDFDLKEINVPTGAINGDVVCKAGNYPLLSWHKWRSLFYLRCYKCDFKT